MDEMEKFFSEMRALKEQLEGVVKFVAVRASPEDEAFAALKGMPPVSVSMENAAAAIGVGLTLFTQLVKKGEIPTFFVKRRRLVRMADLHDWAARQVKPASVRVPKTKRKTEGDKVRAALKKR